MVLFQVGLVSVSTDIMVEDYVEFGPLDLFLHKESASINAEWKLIVSLQLASALTYLVSSTLFAFYALWLLS